jgi:hypothetical protein
MIQGMVKAINPYVYMHEEEPGTMALIGHLPLWGN